MDRGKTGSGRGGKSKALHPVDLFALGAKGSRELAESKRSSPAKLGTGHNITGQDRKRDLPSTNVTGIPTKKPKLESSSSSTSHHEGGTGSKTLVSDNWERYAIEVDPSEFVNGVIKAMDSDDIEHARALICGAVKTLKTKNHQPDKILYLGLTYIATEMPQLFVNNLVLHSLCSILKRDPTLNFKSKGNTALPVLAANLLHKGYGEQKNWPELFVKVFIDDYLGERVWVELEETKSFISNILTGFGTKTTSYGMLPLDPLAPPGIRSDSPTVNTGIGEDDESGHSAGTNSSGKQTSPMPRFQDFQSKVELAVMEVVKDQLSRRQTPDSVNRNFLRLLAVVCGLTEVRLAVVPRLEVWLQNPKLSRPAQELLLALCANCTTHSDRDVEVIKQLVKLRLKTKALLNIYLVGIKKLIAAHPDNLSPVLKLTIYNELSATARSPNNMAVLAVLFQEQPDESARVLAAVVQELLLNKEDYLRNIRGLLRELVRVVRNDLPLVTFCKSLCQDRRDQTFKEFTPKERMMSAIADLVSLCILLAICPAVREAAALLSRGDKKEIRTLNNFRMLLAEIQHDAIWWLKDTVPKMFHPSSQDFVHALHKVLFLEPAEQYHCKDSWPTENERSTMYRLASEVPVLQNTLVRLALMGTSKEHPISCPDVLEILDRIVKRAAGLQSSDLCSPLQVTKTELFDYVFNLCTYRHPENITLPSGYQPPQLAIGNLYWKSWLMLLILSSHNPPSLGDVAWEKYPTLRALMEMCITNHFTFPPPTMMPLEEDKKEAQLTALEKTLIMEFETHLAAASTKMTINENTSLLISQLTSLDPTGPARKPPQPVLVTLKTLNDQLHLGHRLCRSRRPDFLLDVIQRQGASQAMPWLADLVESSEGALSHLPVQCLCEFLLSESCLEVTDSPAESVQQAQQSRQMKQQQLVAHLRGLLYDTSGSEAPVQCCEVLEYFLRRLSSAQAAGRMQAIKGLKLLLSPHDEEYEELGSTDAAQSWLLQQLPALPHFLLARPQAVLTIRHACLEENDLAILRAYLQFLSIHAINDKLADLTDLVYDMALLIVERNTIAQALLPSTEYDINEPAALRTLHALMQLFIAYLNKAREPRKEAYVWSESQDQILVTWSTGEESTMHILVVHAMIILLTYGPGQDPELFADLADTWVPTASEPPKAFLVDTSEEALLIPDWLKLRMIQSSAPGLVDAALKDLEASQLLLFVQSFGIPTSNMSKLLLSLDRAVETDVESVRESVQDKTFMVQLVQVQHYRGAVGGHKLLQLLQEPAGSTAGASTPDTAPNTALRPVLPSIPVLPPQMVAIEEVPWLIDNIFTANGNPSDMAVAFNRLQRALAQEVRNFNENNSQLSLLTSMINLLELKTSKDPLMICHIFKLTHFSCSLLRYALTLKRSKLPKELGRSVKQLCLHLLAAKQASPVTELVRSYFENRGSRRKSTEVREELGEGRISTKLQPFQSKYLIKSAVEKLLDPDLCANDSSSCSSSTGFLLDWISYLEPELIATCPEQEMKLLFSKLQGTSANFRPFLLTLLTHRTSWATLQQCVVTLLQSCNSSYDPAAVLDFLWALIGNPKLWQGREKRIPKHHQTEHILKLSGDKLCILLNYVMQETLALGYCESLPATFGKHSEVLEARVPLILQCTTPESMKTVVRHLAPIMVNRDEPRCRVSQQLLLQLYLRTPSLIFHLKDSERDVFLCDASSSNANSCSLDNTSHCLISAMTETVPSKEWGRKVQEYERLLRKMSATHPILVLRQLPMMAASLKGRVHLESPVFRNCHHLQLFNQMVGVLELLQPYVFENEYAVAFQDTMDSFFAMFQQHYHMKEIQSTLTRVIALLQNFVSYDAQRTLKYLQKHCQLLHNLNTRFHGIAGLHSLLAGLSLPARDGDEPELLVAAAIVAPAENVNQSQSTWAQSQVSQLLVRLAKYTQGEDVLPALQDLDHMSVRRPSVLESCADTLSKLLLSPSEAIRNMAHVLMLRYMRFAPNQAGVYVPAYLQCLDSTQPDVQASALLYIPDVVIYAQEHALTILEKLFQLGVYSGVPTSTWLSRSVALLQLQSGC